MDCVPYFSGSKPPSFVTGIMLRVAIRSLEACILNLPVSPSSDLIQATSMLVLQCRLSWLFYIDATTAVNFDFPQNAHHVNLIGAKLHVIIFHPILNCA